MTAPGSREWDAGTYDRVSGPQFAWGNEVVDELELDGSETVLDAGCGSGRVSELVLARLDPAAGGRLICVDGSAAMVAEAQKRLGPGVTVIHSDLLKLTAGDLGGPVDALVSTATFHWVLDHDALFAAALAWLKPGGRIRAQCGGEGNVGRFYSIAYEVAEEEPYAEHVGSLPPSRYFASAEETRERLEGVGFTDVECWLQPRDTQPDEPREFIRTVCLGPHVDALPEALQKPFIDDVFARWSERDGGKPVLDYVRLNIRARRPGEGT
jgi:trans-aconitate 2-methyltransferase